MLNFNFSEKGLGLASSPYFLYDFSRKMFLMLRSINCLNYLIVFTSRVIGHMCITVDC